jgi:cell division protease FtsH
MQMVTEFGMSEKIGNIALQRPSEEVFLGRDISRNARHSGKTSEIIDEEVKSIIDFARSKAAEILKKHRGILNKIVDYLLERENLDAEDIDKIVQGQDLLAMPAVSQETVPAQDDKNKIVVKKEGIKAKIVPGKIQSETV